MSGTSNNVRATGHVHVNQVYAGAGGGTARSGVVLRAASVSSGGGSQLVQQQQALYAIPFDDTNGAVECSSSA